MVICGILGRAEPRLELPLLARQAIFAGYALGSAVYLLIYLVRPLCYRVNPYYAARQVERTVPGSKNSIVNWLDLRPRELPAGLRAALSQRAAQDLARANLEEAFSGRTAGRLGFTTTLLSVGLALFLIILAALHYPALTLLGRAFAPFSTGPLPTRTKIELVQPRGGDVTLPASRSIHVIARVGGRVPDAGDADALKLLFRLRQTDPYEEQPLDLVTDREWVRHDPIRTDRDCALVQGHRRRCRNAGASHPGCAAAEGDPDGCDLPLSPLFVPARPNVFKSQRQPQGAARDRSDPPCPHQFNGETRQSRTARKWGHFAWRDWTRCHAGKQSVPIYAVRRDAPR